MKSPKIGSALTLGCMLAVMLVGSAGAEVDKVRVGVQPGLTHLPWAVIEHERLIDGSLGDPATDTWVATTRDSHPWRFRRWFMELADGPIP